MRRLAKSIAKNGPHANAPSRADNAVPKRTGTADAVSEKGRASRNHSAKMDRREFVAFIGLPATAGPSIRTPREGDRAPHLDLRFLT
jgi:hypothetical protein